jgi:cytochrome c5
MTRSLLQTITLLLLVATDAIGGAREEPSPTRPKESMAPAATESLTSDKREGVLAEGEAVYRRVCIRCHEKGVSGAPKLGDREAWKVRIPGGIDFMIRNAIEGFQGNQGVHPPRGGDRSLNDAQIEAAVRYMVEQSKENPAVP